LAVLLTASVRSGSVHELFLPDFFPVDHGFDGCSAAPHLALTRAFGIVVMQPVIQIGLQRVNAFAELLAERDLIELLQNRLLLACATVIYVYLGFGIYEAGMEYAAGDVSFTSLGIPQSWSYAALLFGYLLLGLTALGTTYRLITGGQTRIEDELVSAVVDT